MADWIQFGDERGKTIACEVCEAMCLDAVDGTLSPAEQALFELHVAGCAACAEQFAEAQRGAAWMEMLKAHKPEPSASLLASILAKTSGAEAGMHSRDTVRVDEAQLPDADRATRIGHPTYAPPFVMPLPVVTLPTIVAAPAVAGGGRLLPFRQRFRPKFVPAAAMVDGQVYLQPRLFMTAAMAFFSLAMTMGLTGTRFSDLRPGAIHRTVTNANANVVRSFQSLPVVYQVEARLSESRQVDTREEREGTGSSSNPERSVPAPSSNRPAPASTHSPAPPADKPQEKPSAPNGSSELLAPAEPKLPSSGTTTAGTTTAGTAFYVQPAMRQRGA